MPLRWVMLLVLFIVRLAMGYQFQSVASVSSHLIAEFGFSYIEIGALIGFFLMPGIVISIPSGALTGFVSDKNLLMLGALLMIAGALIMAFTDSPDTLYVGRLITGVGGVIFNIILTKMVTEWFFGQEIVTALAIMLTAWPIGISLGLLTQGAIADAYGWQWAMHGTMVMAVIALLLTAGLYRAPPGIEGPSGQRLKFGLPRRQFIHISVVGLAWTLFNAGLIIFISFAPDVLIRHGYDPDAARSVTSFTTWAMLISAPFGGRILEVFGWINVSIVATMILSAVAMAAISQGIAPEALCLALGAIIGIPAGALMALTAEAISAPNRGPGLGIFFTWYYAGMAAGPALAGWTRDFSGSAAVPVILAATMLVGVIACLAVFRLLQTVWPIETESAIA